MKRSKRIIALTLLVSIMISLLPLVQFIHAAEVVQRYELDTDGIDPDATYLIVNTGSAGSANALMFYYQSSFSRDLKNQTLTIKSKDGTVYIDSGFSNEDDCQFQFTGSASGKVTHGNYAIDLDQSRYASTNSGDTLTFTHVGNGQYRIYSRSLYRAYYLRYNNSDWTGSTTTSSVYLFKLTDHVVGYNVTFDGNGYTSGTLPANPDPLSPGATYTIPEPPVALRKDEGEDTWLFQCWNTMPDGSGTEYAPGETITITEDITLYADWYQQAKYTVSMITYLDGTPTDVDKFASYDRQFYAMLEGGDGSYIPLTKHAEGTYSTKVTKNGTYTIYAITADGRYEQVHGHNVVIYSQDGSTECLHYSVNYDTNGGTWATGEAPAAEYHHYGESVTAHGKIPTKAGYRFLGWMDQHGNLYDPGQVITEQATEKITLTAIWDEQITVTVKVVIDHNATTGGVDRDSAMHDIIFTLMREENGVNLPIEEKVLNAGYTYDAAKGITTYTIVFDNMPKALYHVSTSKSNYDTTISYAGNANVDQTITVHMEYRPSNFDLNFDVIVKADNAAEKQLMPQAVNVKISFWGYGKGNSLGWQIITQHEGDNAPVTVAIDANGKGSGFYPVWQYWSGESQPYAYRVEVTSFVMPDGSIVPASGNHVVYTADGSGLYQATVSIEGEKGLVPTHPNGSNTTLAGSYFDGADQNGIPTITVEINPMTVTFDAGNGKVNGQQTLKLNNQYRYPTLRDYVAIPNDASKIFMGWVDADGNPVTDLEGQLLTGNVTFYAKYNENITLSGTVTAEATYQQDGQTVQINNIDRVSSALVVLQKKVGDVYNDIDSVFVDITYVTNAQGVYVEGVGNYTFTNLPNDGTEYRVHVLVLNYTDVYDNDQNNLFSKSEATVLTDMTKTTAQVDVHLRFVPASYQQMVSVDASQIHPDFRPTDVLAQILYRDLGDVHNYNVISQHSVSPYGIAINLDNASASGTGADDVWNYHTDGALYEYQLLLYKLFGNVKGVYTTDGTVYVENPYFTVDYGPSNNYLNESSGKGITLEATLVPKTYSIHLDLNLGTDSSTPVFGLENYMVDDGTSRELYAFEHTWSFTEQFTAYPYREGYVFLGWTSPTDDVHIEDGVVYVGNTLAQDITLIAQWEKLSGTDYTILYRELNTEKVLHSTTLVSGSVLGSTVVAADQAIAIKGYIYAGATIDGAYINKLYNPVMIVTDNPANNLMVIYYLPDTSSGYTEQVESNLEINKFATLENNGTFTITLDTYTKDNPITTKIRQDTPLDVVLVLDQSGSMYTNGALNDLKEAVNTFITLLADHGRTNEVDHRLAIVGYASANDDGYTSNSYPTAGKDGSYLWYNTGVFGVHGDFHPYSTTGFNYTQYDGLVTADGTYYTKAGDEYLLLTYHTEYRHLVTEKEAREALLDNTTIYGYVDGQFVELTRNSSGLWLYGDKKLYSSDEFFTYHTDVWTHREGLERREIHAYGLGSAYQEVGDHKGVYTRTATKDANPQKSLYKEALIPVSLGANGSGGITPGLTVATQKLGANGYTRVSYGMEMANNVFAENPLEAGSDRERIIIVFTDGKPGDGSNFDEAEANRALTYANIASNTYGANIYSIGLYGKDVVSAESDQVFFMNGLSSNYPNATKMDDIWVNVTYHLAESDVRIDLGGPYYVKVGDSYYLLTRSSVYENKTYYNCWGYTDNSGNRVIISKTATASGHPYITNSKIGDYDVYRQYGEGYETAQNTGYYVEASSSVNLKEYFAQILRDITTNTTTEIILKNDTILRDIMNQGLIMTKNTVITVYTQEGNFNLATGTIDWAVDAKGNPILAQKVQLNLATGATEITDAESGVSIYTYNLDAANATNPDKGNYHPHTVDVTGYDFYNWYISDTHTKGYKMVVTITGIEATEDVQWGCSTATNNNQSGLWLPADKDGNRQLLLPFDQPTTIFVERAYVLDYGKEFVLSNWYFDDEDGKDATPIHLDLDITNGMNFFDVNSPNVMNTKDGIYGNTKYGNVRLENGNVIYSPTTMNWGSYDSFYVFGNTWRKTVLAQDANANGNLWNKVTVIPANNIYYEDSFITTDSTTQNGIEGFTFTGAWSVVGQDSNNIEQPEHLESAPYGDVHGWTDSLGDDVTFTDGSAHFTNTPGTSAQFTFTGTGVEVYTRTNQASGMVVAVLNSKATDANGNEVITLYKSLAMDNLAMSGDYYHIPTVAFKDLPYGTYTLQLIATTATIDETGPRYEYYIDGVRIHNPLGQTTNYQSDIVKDAYGLENNAVFTEVRDILLDYGDFNVELPDSTDGKQGAVFIDWIRDGQGTGNDKPGAPTYTYELGTFETYGPKNEVYLSAGQAIVLKVADNNTYYVGLKSLTGGSVAANVSGVDQTMNPTTITITHTTDMYYRINPINGYIVIQNGNTDGAILSITNLRTTNMRGPVANGGVLSVTPQTAVATMQSFTTELLEQANIIKPEKPTEDVTTPSVQVQTEATLAFASALFVSVRQWLENA